MNETVDDVEGSTDEEADEHLRRKTNPGERWASQKRDEELRVLEIKESSMVEENYSKVSQTWLKKSL